MSLATEIFGAVRKMLIIDEDLTRLTGEVKSLTAEVRDLDLRLTVVETTMPITRRSSKLILPGN